MERAEDSDILQLARSESRVCVTLDHDFHAHLATTGHGRPSVMLLRVQGLDATGQAALIRSVYLQCEAAISLGRAPPLAPPPLSPYHSKEKAKE